MSCRRIDVTGVTLTAGTSLEFTISPRTFDPRCSYEMCVCIDLTNAVGTEVLQINDGTTTYPLLNCVSAEPYLAGQIPQNCHLARGTFRLTYGAETTPHFVVKHPAPNFCTYITPTEAAGA